MTTFLSWFLLRELIQVRVWIALLVTYSGVLVLYAHEASLSGSDVTLGILLVMSAALSYSLYLVLGKKLIAGIGSLLFTCIAMLASTVFVTLHYSTQHAIQDLFNEPDAPPLSGRQVPCLRLLLRYGCWMSRLVYFMYWG